MQFFKEAVMQPRFPRSTLEGAIKGLLIAAVIWTVYDALDPIPQTREERVSETQIIVNGYILFLSIGLICGLLGESFLNNDQQASQLRR
ncbi:MAG: hypothetical protein K0Q74_171 [Gammaproteobacteria bacterium]|jgi:H+/Cl- antiporter ClcA|nr:hypothetical protein [Gammaproteobacteria bacterium]